MTEEFAAWKPIDEQMGFDERVRLLYVAATRACDHLVVSLHRRARKGEVEPLKRTNAELLVDGMGQALLDTVPDAAGAGEPVPVVTPPAPAPIASLAEWAAARDAAVAVAARPTAVAATALTEEGDHDPAGDAGLDAPADVDADGGDGDGGVEPRDGDAGAVEPRDGDAGAGGVDAGLQKRPRDLDLPPWLKGRYGTAVGRAVHGTLQTIDLATGAGIEAAVAAQCEAEAIPDRHEQVRVLVQHALAAPSVREAAAAPHWREVYACVPVDGRLLEGYVDLLYRGRDGLVVVDHKTSASADPAELDRRLAGYRLQGASYALTVAAATGEPVARVTFLFLTPEGAIERHLPDLDAAVAHVRALVTAGEELTVDEPFPTS
jgi:ATP-dependent exoDNAse (exonuclease V) beta subunit